MKSPIIKILLLLILFSSCISTKKMLEQKNLEEQKLREDSTEFISYHPSKPFVYGDALNSEECIQYKSLFDFCSIKNGETVASVGAASGWREGIFSTFVDSVTFYIQDIDTTFLNNDQLSKVVKYYSAIRGKPQTNQFELVIGEKGRTLLPEYTFDKIIIANAFHEIYRSRKAPQIILDLKHKLKKGGQLIIEDEASNDFLRVRHLGCGIKALKAKKLVELFESFGFHLSKIGLPINSLGNYFVFEMDKEKNNNFESKQRPLLKYLEELDRVFLEKNYTDSNKINQIVKNIKPNISILADNYSFMEDYLIYFSNQLCEKEKYKEAVNVLNANLILFPKSTETFESLGDIFYNLNELHKAILNYKKALDIKPGDKELISIIKEIEALYPST